MTVYYELTERKPFVKALEEITGEKAKYKGTPSYAYEVGCFTISREGNLIFNDMADPEEMDRVLDALEQKGYMPIAASMIHRSPRSPRRSHWRIALRRIANRKPKI